jgi:hypothetical protein
MKRQAHIASRIKSFQDERPGLRPSIVLYLALETATLGLPPHRIQRKALAGLGNWLIDHMDESWRVWLPVVEPLSRSKLDKRRTKRFKALLNNALEDPLLNRELLPVFFRALASLSGQGSDIFGAFRALLEGSFRRHSQRDQPSQDRWSATDTDGDAPPKPQPKGRPSRPSRPSSQSSPEGSSTDSATSDTTQKSFDFTWE